jgi:F-type H+-transporting ATPase subunit a
MPNHTSFFTYLIAMFPALGENMKNIGPSVAGQPMGASSAEPAVAALFVALLVMLLALLIRSKITKHDDSVIPDDKLTLRTFFEIFIGYAYDQMKDMMGAKKAKRYFPVVGTAACFIFFSNFLGLLPGFNPPTSTWSITWGCAIVVFITFNYYGIKENGLGYFKHLFGPWLGPIGIPVNILLFVIETFSLFLRPFTLSIRLMLNMAVDHLLLTLAISGFALFLPIPVMILGTLVAVVQVLVFCLLSSIYITLATEHEEGHGEDHAQAGPQKKPNAAAAHA